MTLRLNPMLMTLAVVLVAGCASVQPAPGGPVTTPLARSATTVSGQPLRLPQGPVEVVVAAAELPPGGRLPAHRHAWSRTVYVERGRVRVKNLDTGAAQEFGPGQVIVEALDQWHEAEVIGPDGLRLIVVDYVPAGQSNMALRNAPAP